MPRITLDRTGNRPLAFEGERIAVASSRHSCDVNRWHNISLYRTTNGNFVLCVEYWTIWQGETDHSDAVIVDSVDAIVDVLRATDPSEHATGMPVYNDAMRVKEDRRRAELQARYDAAVSELLADLPEELA